MHKFVIWFALRIEASLLKFPWKPFAGHGLNFKLCVHDVSVAGLWSTSVVPRFTGGPLVNFILAHYRVLICYHIQIWRAVESKTKTFLEIDLSCPVSCGTWPKFAASFFNIYMSSARNGLGILRTWISSTKTNEVLYLMHKFNAFV